MLSSPGESFYAFYNPRDLSKLQNSINQLDRYISAEGPFDAIMGFSGGAVLAAMYLKHQHFQQDQGEGEAKLPFKCGIFLSSASCRMEGRTVGVDVEGAGKSLIAIPTVHIWGSNDAIAPTGGEDVSSMCDPAQRQILVHDGGHEVPRQDYLVESVHAIRRTLDLAERRSGTGGQYMGV